jgi:ribosomal protein S18 acetylase RimI-like enzyme
MLDTVREPGLQPQEKQEAAPRGRSGDLSDVRPSELAHSIKALPSLLGHARTWQVLFWWTVSYGIASWWIEYLFSMFDPAGPIAFWFGLNRVVYAVVWSGAIVVAILATEQFPITSRTEIGRMVTHIGIMFVVTVLWGVLAYYICLTVVPGWKPLGIGRMLAATAKNVLFGYGLVVLLVHILLQVRLHRQREVAALREAGLAAQAQLQILKMELQPHFLFNALHSISALMQSDVRAANDTLVRVSDMLRHAVRTTHVQEVSLREELATLQLFTEIEEVRFGDRLRLTWDVE